MQKFVFPFINLCATSSTALALLEYLNKVVKMIMGWQLGLLDNDNLFEKFATHGSDISSDLMSPYGGMHISNYGWWKDQFDVLGFEMLDQITLDELIELSQAHARQTVSHLSSGYLIIASLGLVATGREYVTAGYLQSTKWS